MLGRKDRLLKLCFVIGMLIAGAPQSIHAQIRTEPTSFSTVQTDGTVIIERNTPIFTSQDYTDYDVQLNQEGEFMVVIPLNPSPDLPTEIFDLNSGMSTVGMYEFAGQEVFPVQWSHAGDWVLMADVNVVRIATQYGETSFLLEHESAEISYIGWSADDSQIYTALSGTAKCAREEACNHALRVWDMATGEFLYFVGGESDSEISQSSFSPDGQYLAYAGGLWDITAPSDEPLFAIEEPVYFSNDSNYVWNKDGRWDIATGESLPSTDLDIWGETYFPKKWMVDSDQLIAARSDAIEIWNAETGDLVRSIVASESDFVAVYVAPDRTTALTRRMNGSLAVWDLVTGQALFSIEQGITSTDTVSLQWDTSLDRISLSVQNADEGLAVYHYDLAE